MAKLKDYSGPYKDDLRFSDFSKDFLIELMHSWQWAYMRLSSLWYQEVSERFGLEAGDKCNLAVWNKVGEKIAPRFAKVGHIEPKTVLDGLKTIQLAPDGHTDSKHFEGDVDIRSANHIITTTRRCVILEWLEKAAPERIDYMCHELEKQVMEKYFNNPKIKVTPLKLPPRKGPDDICCKFDIKLEG
jgi:hypothetical protein